MARVRIVKKPTAKTGLEVRMSAGLYGTNGNRQFSLPTQIDSQKYSEPDTEVRNTLQPVPRHQANLEAEKGETAVVNIDGFPAHFNIGGKRHSKGGTPLNLPDNSFIFSDTAKMKIKDPEILKQFGMSLKSGGFTPADIAKKYQINEYRKLLADPETDDLQRKTAELMISNYNEKLAKLALAQESKKGFPQGIPAMAMPYIQAHDIDPAQYIPTQGQEEDPNADMGVARYGANVIAGWNKKYGGLPTAQTGYTITNKGADFSDVVGYLKQRETAKAKEKLYKEAYQKAYAAELKKWEENKSKEKEEATRLASEKRSQYVQENELKRRENIVRQLTNELKNNPASGADVTEEKLNKALSDYQAYKNKHFPTTITYNTPKQDKPSSKPYVMSEGEKEYRFGKKPAAQPKKAEIIYTDEEFALGGIKLDAYQDKGEKKEIVTWEVSKKTGNRRPVYADGTKGPVEKAAAPPAQPQGDVKVQKKPAGLPGGANQKVTVRPYGEDPEVADFMKKHLTKGSADLYGQEIGYQKKDPKTGHYAVEDITEEDWRKSNKQFLEEHPDFDPKNPKHLGQYENWYNDNTKKKAYRKALYDAKKKGMQAEEAEKYAQDFSQRVVEQIGFVDKKGDVRDKDLKWGKYHRSRKEFEFEPDPEQPTPPTQVTIKPEEKKEDAVREPFPKANLQPVKGNTNTPWWLQDIIGTAGAAGDMARIKKYQPWQATPQAFLPQATFYDPTRELAANAEQANIASQFHQAFTGPKTGQMAGVQGQAMKNAADIMARYNNMNVGVANQLEQERAHIMNQSSQQRANLATGLWDKYTIANQQFDNAKNQAREQLRKHVISAVTNRAKTQALNSLYPNYYTDPSTGGMLGFHPDFTKIPATQPNLKNAWWEAVELTGSPENALKYLELQSKGSISDPYGERRGYMGAQGYGE